MDYRQLSVYVLNPEVFAKCIAWEAERIQSDWDAYFNAPAVI